MNAIVHDVTRRGHWFALLLVLAFAAACGGGASEPAMETPTAQSTSTPRDETGLAAVSAAIEAITTQETRALAGLVSYETLPCSPPVQGAGGPPACASGEAAGTAVDVLPTMQCEGEYVRPGDMLEALDRFVGPDVRVYGAWYRSRGQYWPEGDFTVVLMVRDDASIEVAREVMIDARGRIVGLNFGCGESAAQLVERHRLTLSIDLH